MTSLALPDPTLEIMPVYAMDAHDTPTLHVLNHPISMTQLIKRSAAQWGVAMSRDIKRVVDDVFRGFNYDRDYPRELFIDTERNCIWAFCYRRPKPQDPHGNLLVKTLIQFADVFPVGQLIEQGVEVITLEALQRAVMSDPLLSTCDVPLAGGMDGGAEFIRQGYSRQQFIHIGNVDHQITRIDSDIRWLLGPEDMELTNATIAQRVSRRDFFHVLKGQHRLASEYVSLVLRYIQAIGATPHFFTVRTDTQRNFAVRYTVDVDLGDAHLWPLHGGVFVASRFRPDLQ